jgi:hypothetical protein
MYVYPFDVIYFLKKRETIHVVARNTKWEQFHGM